MKKYFVLLILLFSTVFITACASTKAQDYTLDKTKLAQRYFELESVNGNPVTGERVPTLEFDHDFRLFGGICNRFSGQAELKGDVITAKMMSTNMFCEESGLMDLEFKFFQMLAAGAKITMKNDKLTLIQGGNTLVYQFKKFVQ